MTDSDSKPRRVEVALPDDQIAALDEVTRWEREALLELGEAHIHQVNVEGELAAAKGRTTACEERVHHASAQRARVLSVIAAMLELPPGEWTYDSQRGKLVKREPHAQST